MSDPEVECQLCQKLLEKEAVRAKQMRSRYERTTSYDQQLNHLLKEVDELERLLKIHVAEVYADIINGLERLGLRTEELQKLNTQLQNLKATLYDCKTLRQRCTMVLGNITTGLEDCQKQLNTLLKTFIDTVNYVEQMTAMLEKTLPPQKSGSYVQPVGVGLVAGLLAGSLTGTAIMPGLGTAVGAAYDWIAGKQIYQIRQLTGTALLTQENSTHSTRRVLRNCDQIRDTAQKVHEHIQQLFTYM